MIRPYYFAISLALSGLIFVGPVAAKVPKLSSKKQYIAGIVILNRASGHLSESKRSEYFQLLQEVTGISEEKGGQLLAAYTKDPKKWEEDLEEIDAYLIAQTKYKKEQEEALMSDSVSMGDSIFDDTIVEDTDGEKTITRTLQQKIKQLHEESTHE